VPDGSPTRILLPGNFLILGIIITSAFPDVFFRQPYPRFIPNAMLKATRSRPWAGLQSLFRTGRAGFGRAGSASGGVSLAGDLSPKDMLTLLRASYPSDKTKNPEDPKLGRHSDLLPAGFLGMMLTRQIRKR